MKYGGIHYDYGQLTFILFLILVSLQSAVCQDSIIIQSLNKGQNSKLAYSCIRDKEGLNALVCEQRTGISRAPYSKSMSLKRLVKIESEDRGLSDIHKINVSNSKLASQADLAFKINLTPHKEFKFGVKFFSIKNKKSQKTVQPFSCAVNDLSFAQKIHTYFLPGFGIVVLVNEHKYKAGLLVIEMIEYLYSHIYQNYFITKRIAPIEINISHEKLAIRACDLFRFLTISFLTTKSEYSNSLIETICNNCYNAVACDCVNPFTGQCVKVLTQNKKGGLPMKHAC